MKRTYQGTRKAILAVLSDGNDHSFCDLERKANTNWKSVRAHCYDLSLLELAVISKNKVKITTRGTKFIEKLAKVP